MKFDKKFATEWQEIGTYFMVEIKNWQMKKDQNCWHVHCYIYRGHRLFEELKYRRWKRHDIQKYFHHGISSHHSFITNKKITTICLGSDYQHYGDHYELYDETNMPPVVLEDAIKLYDYLEAK